MKHVLAAAALALTPVVVEAAPIYAPVPVDNYINYMGSDWAWASPCAATNGCSSIDLSYQTTQGWRLPTASEISTYIESNLGAFVAAFYDGSGYKCASAWFDVAYSHCDSGDALAGYIWGTSTAYGYYDETFVIRASVVPVPAAGLMLATALAGAAGLRLRRRSKKA